MIKYILFDVAGTLLYKPKVFTTIKEVLEDFDIKIPLNHIIKTHKTVSEIIFFPDKTDATFYKNFNAEFLRSLGIIPHNDLLERIFEKCTYLPWEKYEDTEVLEELPLPLGILSNFNTTLKDKIKSRFSINFANIFVSEEFGCAKPDAEFFKKALSELSDFKPEEILYIGDSIKLDIEPAERIGLNTLLIDRHNNYLCAKNKIENLREIKHLL